MVVNEVVAGAFLGLPKPVVEVVDAVDELLALGSHLIHDVGCACCCCERGEDVHVGLDAAEYLTCGNVARPAHHHRNAYAALIGRHFLAAEGRSTAVETGAVLRAVVGGVNDDGIVQHAHGFHAVEQFADLHVVFDQTAAIEIVLGGVGLCEVAILVAKPGIHVHPTSVEPHEERLVRLLRALHEVQAGGHERLIHCLHPLLAELAGVLDSLFADLAEAGIDCRIVHLGGIAMQHATSAVFLKELRILWIVHLLELLLGVEMIEIAKELVESMHGRQVLVTVAEVVLAELSGSVSEGLEHFRQSRRFRLQAQRCARPTDGGHAAADGILPRDECSASSSTGRLGVMVREHDALSGDAVDVRRPIAHRTVAIGADILPPHIIWKNDEDVRLLVLRLSGRQREDSKEECDENNLAIHMGWFISIRPVLRGSCR